MSVARRTKFYLDRRHRKVMGVCSGLADYTGFDVTLIRVGMIVATVAGSGAMILVYLVTAWIARDKPRELANDTPEETKFWQGVRASPGRGVRDVRSRFRDLDRRLADIETHVTTGNMSLANEIEKLR